MDFTLSFQRCHHVFDCTVRTFPRDISVNRTILENITVHLIFLNHLKIKTQHIMHCILMLYVKHS